MACKKIWKCVRNLFRCCSTRKSTDDSEYVHKNKSTKLLKSVQNDFYEFNTNQTIRGDNTNRKLFLIESNLDYETNPREIYWPHHIIEKSLDLKIGQILVERNLKRFLKLQSTTTDKTKRLSDILMTRTNGKVWYRNKKNRFIKKKPFRKNNKNRVELIPQDYRSDPERYTNSKTECRESLKERKVDQRSDNCIEEFGLKYVNNMIERKLLSMINRTDRTDRIKLVNQLISSPVRFTVKNISKSI
jgi:hypothetical protein